MEILNKEISKEATAKIEIVGGKLVITAALDSSGLDAALTVSVDSDYFIDQIAAKIPGTLDDVLLGVLKSALKAV